MKKVVVITLLISLGIKCPAQQNDAFDDFFNGQLQSIRIIKWSGCFAVHALLDSTFNRTDKNSERFDNLSGKMQKQIKLKKTGEQLAIRNLQFSDEEIAAISNDSTRCENEAGELVPKCLNRMPSFPKFFKTLDDSMKLELLKAGSPLSLSGSHDFTFKLVNDDFDTLSLYADFINPYMLPLKMEFQDATYKSFNIEISKALVEFFGGKGKFPRDGRNLFLKDTFNRYTRGVID